LGFVLSSGVSGIPTGNTPRSVTFWFKVNATGTATLSLETGGNCQWERRTDDPTSVFVGDAFSADSDAVPTGAWKLYAFVWTGAEWLYYENAVLLDSASESALNTNGGIIEVNLAGLSGGRSKMKDIRLYEGVLSADDVAAIYDGSFGP
jgi:hypothetical protein